MRCQCPSCSEGGTGTGPGAGSCCGLGSRMRTCLLGPLLIVLVLLAHSGRAEPCDNPSAATLLRASPRSSPTPLWPVASAPRGYYGHDVGYGSYFPVGLDPLTILAGLAFLAFIIQTLYLLLYKQYGLGIGAGAGVGLGPLSADRHQRQEQQEWANSVTNRIETAAQTYEADASSEHRTDSPVDSAESRMVLEGGDFPAARQLGPSPLEALLSMLRRSWGARTCGSSWLCRLVHFARMLTEPLGLRTAPGHGQRQVQAPERVRVRRGRGVLRARQRAWRK